MWEGDSGHAASAREGVQKVRNSFREKEKLKGFDYRGKGAKGLTNKIRRKRVKNGIMLKFSKDVRNSGGYVI